MARPLRVQYSGAIYHVTCRGNERKNIFRDDGDRKRFLQILRQSLSIYSVKLLSYVLMNNHFHLLLETPLGNLGEFMRQFNISYTGYFNRRHRRIGHLYQGRYKSILVDKHAYLAVLSRYIHLNPVRIKVMGKVAFREKARQLRQYRWSSLHGYLEKRKMEDFVDYTRVLGEYGGETKRARAVYRKDVYADMAGGLEIRDKIIGQSILGGDRFIAWVKDTVLEGKTDRECPSLKEISAYRAGDAVAKVIERETGKRMEEIRAERGPLRQIAMELLYRVGGLKGQEIGRLMGVGYTSVSQERRRLRRRLLKDGKLRAWLKDLEAKCHK